MTHGYRNVLGEERMQTALLYPDSGVDTFTREWLFGKPPYDELIKTVVYLEDIHSEFINGVIVETHTSISIWFKIDVKYPPAGTIIP